MTSKRIVEQYFDALKGRADWKSVFSDSMTFTSFTSPVRQITGRAAFLQATQGFYTSVISVEVRSLIVDGDQVCALTRYDLRSPKGNAFSSDVAEIFHVSAGKVDSFAIYFDSAPFPR